MRLALAVFCVLHIISSCFGIGCIKNVCNRGLKLRKCFKSSQRDDNCGKFNSVRWAGQILKKVDVHCEPGDPIVAPFDAHIMPYSYYNDGSEWDQGLTLRGVGTWAGYVVHYLHCEPKRTHGRVKEGDVVGELVGIVKAPAQTLKRLREENSNDFVQVTMLKAGVEIDPTDHIFNCSCTGTICDSNPKNMYDPKGYHTHDRLGTGYSIACTDLETDGPGSGGEENGGPVIYAPIDGQRIGRIRMVAPKDDTPHAYECEDDGFYIMGSGQWEHFEVKIYNARLTVKENGSQKIEKGSKVARRLTCPGKEIKSVFMEMRYRGRLIDFGAQLEGNSCTFKPVKMQAEYGTADAMF